MTQIYNPESIESKWNNVWMSQKYFKPSRQGEPYCIVLPPPNVTGSLHLGHAFQQTLIDVLIRKKRMDGYSTLWQGGTDHAGIATQIVVEKKLKKRGILRQDLGRESFLSETLQWKDCSQKNIIAQINRLGCSIDPSRNKFSMDKDIEEATFEAFKILYEENLIYKGEKIVNFDPTLCTAVSDLEVQNKETSGHIWYIKYKIHNSDDCIFVATTRPETLFGDTAVAVHPEDDRYSKFIGKYVIVPIVNRLVKIISDVSVKQDFGTGCVKVTPAHDFNDYELGKKHNLETIKIFSRDACLIDVKPDSYLGMDRFAAREKIISELREKKLLLKVDNYKHIIPYSSRSGAIIEPMLTTQWFVKTKDMAKKAVEAVKEKKIMFFPENWTKTYLHWMENIQDWCISRQIWWGHRIPIWSDKKGNLYLGKTKKDVYENYSLSISTDIKQEDDVLDTWFTAALWPFSSLDWPCKTDFLENYYPNSLLVTGFDIIFFWVARMIMMALKLTGKVPFRKVLITGLIKDSQGKKMSKSQGNVIDPMDLVNGINSDDLINKRISEIMDSRDTEEVRKITKNLFPDGIKSYGADALRFTLCSLATFSRDIVIDIKRISGYRNFCNKLWNVEKYISMQIEQLGFSHEQEKDISLFDRWIFCELQNTTKLANNYINNYRFDLLAKALYDFCWNTYCDWYIEISKSILNSNAYSKERKNGTLYTLISVFSTLLCLLHPIIPFITEELWMRLPALNGMLKTTIIKQPYPKVENIYIDKSKHVIDWLKKIVSSIRSARSNMNVSPSKKIDIIFKGKKEICNSIRKFEVFIRSTTKTDNISYTSNEIHYKAIKIIVDSIEIYIPLEGLFNKNFEVERVEKQILKIDKEWKKLVNKIEKPDFVTKAPKNIVEREKIKAEVLLKEIEKLKKYQRKVQNT